jgi:hypothetical protein
MRHADVCVCRDCGLARLNSIMAGMPDTEGKLTLAFAGIELGREGLNVDAVALPYPEVLAVHDRMTAVLDRMYELATVALEDPHAGPFDDMVAEMEEQLRLLRDSWKRD